MTRILPKQHARHLVSHISGLKGMYDCLLVLFICACVIFLKEQTERGKDSALIRLYHYSRQSVQVKFA